MRVVLLVLMMTLLPLRGWLGDAMAIQPVAGHTDTIEIVAVSASKIRAEGPFSINSATAPLPCHEGAAGIAHAADSGPQHAPSTSDNAAAHSDCNACSACQICQICHGAALAQLTCPLPVLALPNQVAHSGAGWFASLPQAPQLKPPIA